MMRRIAASIAFLIVLLTLLAPAAKGADRTVNFYNW